MGKKRKPEDSGLEESDRMVFQNFTTAANSISQVYASVQAQQRLLFLAGEQHGLEKVYQWILARQGEGLDVTDADVVAFLQNELDCGGEDGSMPLTSHPQQTQIQAPTCPFHLHHFRCFKELYSPAFHVVRPGEIYMLSAWQREDTILVTTEYHVEPLLSHSISSTIPLRNQAQSTLIL